MSARTTLVGTPVVVAPGKIFLVGEYAVLDGGVAVLAAVSRYAVAQYVPGPRHSLRWSSKPYRVHWRRLGKPRRLCRPAP